MYVRLVGSFWCFKLFPEILIVDLGITAELEDDETDGGFSENEHGE